MRLAKSEIGRREPVIVGFFILQYAKVGMLDLFHNFFTTFCDTDNYEETEIDTDSLYLELAEKELFDYIRSEER